MKCYPLIDSRTKYQDFVSPFLIRPLDLNVALAKKYIGEIKKHIMQNFDNIVCSVFSVEKYIIVGICCNSIVLAKRINKENDFTEYCQDKDGRNCWCFIGVAIEKSEFDSGTIPYFSFDYFYSLYVDCIKDVWNNTCRFDGMVTNSPWNRSEIITIDSGKCENDGSIFDRLAHYTKQITKSSEKWYIFDDGSSAVSILDSISSIGIDTNNMKNDTVKKYDFCSEYKSNDNKTEVKSDSIIKTSPQKYTRQTGKDESPNSLSDETQKKTSIQKVLIGAIAIVVVIVLLKILLGK